MKKRLLKRRKLKPDQYCATFGTRGTVKRKMGVRLIILKMTVKSTYSLGDVETLGVLTDIGKSANTGKKEECPKENHYGFLHNKQSDGNQSYKRNRRYSDNNRGYYSSSSGEDSSSR